LHRRPAAVRHEACHVEDSERLPCDPVNSTVSNDCSYALETLARLAAHYGFTDRRAFRADSLPGQPRHGLMREKLRELYLTADAILDIRGRQGRR
jgi:hypothetical protein